MKTYEVINLEQPESETAPVPFIEDRYRQSHGSPLLNVYGSYLVMGDKF